MTMYTENVNYRMRTLFAVLSVLSALLTYGLQDWMPVYPWVVAPITLMFFAALFWFFDAILWKAPIIRLLNSGIPNLAGIWKGTLSRSVNGEVTQLAADLTIKQTWSKIDLVLRTEEAVSRNTLAGLTLDHPEGVLLTWVYRIDGTKPLLLTDPGRGIIELILNLRTKPATFQGAFIESQPGEPLDGRFVRPGFTFWNPEPI